MDQYVAHCTYKHAKWKSRSDEKNKLITTANQPNYDLLGFGYIPVYNKKNTCVSNIFNHTVIKNPFWYSK